MPYDLKILKRACDLAAKFHPQNAASSFEQVVMTKRRIDYRLVKKCADKGFIGVDPHMVHEVMPKIKRSANNTANVMVLGSTGTGKEHVARLIHDFSDQSRKPYEAVNCAGLTSEFLKSELFGHKKGAFTGAIANKEGLVEKAAGGTLFLDEIGDMPINIQASLLRFIEYKKYSRVGEAEEREADVRIIVATNKDIGEEIKEGEFRKDLFHRFGDTIQLRDLYLRPGDMPILIYHFINEYNLRQKKKWGEDSHEITELGPLVTILSISSRWDGNIRQLKNVVERACEEAADQRHELRHRLLLLGDNVGVKESWSVRRWKVVTKRDFFMPLSRLPTEDLHQQFQTFVDSFDWKEASYLASFEGRKTALSSNGPNQNDLFGEAAPLARRNIGTPAELIDLLVEHGLSLPEIEAIYLPLVYNKGGKNMAFTLKFSGLKRQWTAPFL